MRWFRVRAKRASTVTKHYKEFKEEARVVIHSRLEYYNSFYGFAYNRVSVRNQRRCWGSCTSLKNLNFSYKLLFLPEHLRDYIIVHELCHLGELNHSKRFWALVSRQIPDYKIRRKQMRQLERNGTSIRSLTSLKEPSVTGRTIDGIAYTQTV